MTRFLPIAASALLACAAAQAQTVDHSRDDFRSIGLGGHHEDCRRDCGRNTPVTAAPEFHAAGAVAALTFLLGGVAVLKGRRRE